MMNLLQFDKELFLYLNRIQFQPIDEFVIFVSEDYFLLLILIPFLYFVYKKIKKKFLTFLICFIFSVGISDLIVSKVIKPSFKRLRPCHEKEIKNVAKLSRLRCGGKFGFVSSHASNSFAASTFIFLSLRSLMPYTWVGFIISFLISFSRIYLAKHYPFDLMGGAIVGIFLGFVFYKIYKFVTREKS